MSQSANDSASTEAVGGSQSGPAQVNINDRTAAIDCVADKAKEAVASAIQTGEPQSMFMALQTAMNVIPQLTGCIQNLLGKNRVLNQGIVKRNRTISQMTEQHKREVSKLKSKNLKLEEDKRKLMAEIEELKKSMKPAPDFEKAKETLPTAAAQVSNVILSSAPYVILLIRALSVAQHA